MAQNRVLAALRGVLKPSIQVELMDDRMAGGGDGLLLLRLAGRPVTVAWLPVGWPKQLREVLRRPTVPDLVAAPELSPGARRLASSEGLSWFDETGAADINLADGHLVIERLGVPATRLDTKLGWRPATLAVCEALLTGCDATVMAVRDRTGLAMSTVATALKFLEAQQLIAAEASRGRHSGRAVGNESALLEAYASAAERLRSPMSVRVGVLWRDPVAGATALGGLWEEAAVSWSATSALSAEVLAPVLTEVSPLEIYVDQPTLPGLRQAAAAAGLRELAGGRLLLRPFPTPAFAALSTQLRPGFWSVPWPRVFADLRLSGVRGEDAAEHLQAQLADG